MAGAAAAAAVTPTAAATTAAAAAAATVAAAKAKATAAATTATATTAAAAATATAAATTAAAAAAAVITKEVFLFKLYSTKRPLSFDTTSDDVVDSLFYWQCQIRTLVGSGCSKAILIIPRYRDVMGLNPAASWFFSFYPLRKRVLKMVPHKFGTAILE